MSSKKQKRADTDGFSRGNMVERLASIKRYSADWRRVNKRHVVITTLLQKFQHSSGSETVVQHICPWGMKNVITRLLGQPHYFNPDVLPKQLRNDHPVLMQTYKKEEWTLVIANTGAKEPTDYQRLYCNYCQTHLIPRLIQEFKGSLGENPSVDSLIANWDALKIPEKYLDYVGCFLPWDPKTQAGPNARKFTRDQSEHPKISHIYTVTAKPSSKKLKRQFTLSSPPPPSKTMALAPPDQNPAPASTQSSIAGKFSKKHLKQASLDKFLEVIPLVGET